MVRYKDKKEIYFLSTILEIKMEKLPKRGHDKQKTDMRNRTL